MGQPYRFSFLFLSQPVGRCTKYGTILFPLNICVDPFRNSCGSFYIQKKIPEEGWNRKKEDHRRPGERRLTWGIFLCFSFNFFSVCSNEHENRKENETLATMQIGKNLLILFFFNNFSSCFYRRNITPNERLLVLFCDFFTSERDACGKKMFRFAYFYTFSLFSLIEETLRFDTFLL